MKTGLLAISKAIFLVLLGGGSVVLAAEPIKIGMITVLSGPFMDNGLEEKRGADLAVEEINAKGGVLGRKIEVIYEDEQMKPAVGIDKLVKLIQLDKVDFIIGGHSSATGMAIGREMPKYKKICVMTVPATEEITGKYCNRYVFRVSVNSAMESISGAVFMASKPYKKIFLLGADYAWGHASCELFKKEIKKIKPDVEIVGEVFTPFPTKDFAPYITKVLQANPDALWLSLWGADFITFAKQGLEFGVQKKVKIFSQVVGYPRELGPAGFDATEGIYAGARYTFAIDTKENKAFVERWLKKYNRYPDSGCETYDGIMMLMDAVKKAGGTNTDPVIKAFEGLQFNSPKGLLTMRKCDHQAVQGVFWGKVARDTKYPFPVMTETILVPAEKAMLSCQETGCKME